MKILSRTFFSYTFASAALNGISNKMFVYEPGNSSKECLNDYINQMRSRGTTQAQAHLISQLSMVCNAIKNKNSEFMSGKIPFTLMKFISDVVFFFSFANNHITSNLMSFNQSTCLPTHCWLLLWNSRRSYVKRLFKFTKFIWDLL